MIWDVVLLQVRMLYLFSYFFRQTSETLGFEPLTKTKERHHISPLSPSGESNASTPLLQPLLDNDATVRITITGMTCQSCVRSIEETISRGEGIHSIKVNLAEKCGLVQYDPSVITPKSICESIEDMGFEASLPETLDDNLVLSTCAVHIDGMTCNSCVQSIEGTTMLLFCFGFTSLQLPYP